MKSIFQALLVVTLLFLVSVSVLADSGKKVKLKGQLVDISCATEKAEDLGYMRTQHTKRCFQMPACVKSGYGILLPGDAVVKFDPSGNEQAQKLIQASTRDKDWRITVRGHQSGDVLQVTKIELEK
jgi:hypothetical protein